MWDLLENNSGLRDNILPQEAWVEDQVMTTLQKFLQNDLVEAKLDEFLEDKVTTKLREYNLISEGEDEEGYLGKSWKSMAIGFLLWIARKVASYKLKDYAFIKQSIKKSVKDVIDEQIVKLKEIKEDLLITFEKCEMESEELQQELIGRLTVLKQDFEAKLAIPGFDFGEKRRRRRRRLLEKLYAR